MPAIRGVSWNYTTSTTGTSITIPLPEYAQNDLLLAIIVADTGTGSWSSAGWTLVPGAPLTSTAQMVMLYRIAGAAESTPTFTSTFAETYNGCIISIQDVNTTNPFGNPAVTNFMAQAATAKFSMQTVTTNVNNSLLIYAFGGSTIGVPSFLEGPVFGLLGADGSAESLGVGWGFQPTAGTTPNNVVCSTVQSSAGVKAVLQIAPPATGATVIPPYCASDSSFYIDPINGVSAFNGNGAIGATADTNFGTSLGGRTAADATVASASDVGINSFHSAARVTSITGSQNLSGVELVVAAGNRTNFTGKNILVHVGPSTEGQLQRFSSVASGGGIWMGMRSGTATNYKIWQVYGSELGSLRHQPVVINSAAGNTKASAGTLNAASVLAFGFWVVGTGVSTTIWDFASLWMLDTTVIAGGNAANPVGIKGIVSAAATGKERKSCVIQGANQCLIYQPIQFGNGGANPIYLDLDSTAIEFPRQYNPSTAEVTYNSIDDACGIIYYAGPSDTIKHRNSIVSSASKYKWGFHPSSSTAASYNFSGLSVIGAGQITLKAGIPLTNVTFSKCSEILAAGAIFTNCSIKQSTGTAAITVSSPSELSAITGGSIENNNRGIKITAAGTYTLNGVKFSGNTYDIENASTGQVIINCINGANASSVINTAGGTTTINNPVTLTLTGIASGSEVRIYSRDGSGNSNIELAGSENVTTGTFEYTYNYSPGVMVNIVVIHVEYHYYAINGYTLGANNASIPVQQIKDRQYSRGSVFDPS